MLTALAEAHTVTIVVACITLVGVVITALSSVMGTIVSRSTNREVKYRNGNGEDGTLAERLDARFDAIDQRLARIEQEWGLSSDVPGDRDV